MLSINRKHFNRKHFNPLVGKQFNRKHLNINQAIERINNIIYLFNCLVYIIYINNFNRKHFNINQAMKQINNIFICFIAWFI